MNILNDFLETTSIQLDPVDLDVVEPPRFGLTPLTPAGARRDTVGCVNKRAGSLDATVTLSALGGISIPFRGIFLGVDSSGRWLLRWSVDDHTERRAAGFTIERIQGQAVFALTPVLPPRIDLTDCAGAAGEFIVHLTLVPPDERDERFDLGVPNELKVWVTGVTPTRALISAAQGTAGITAPSRRRGHNR